MGWRTGSAGCVGERIEVGWREKSGKMMRRYSEGSWKVNLRHERRCKKKKINHHSLQVQQTHVSRRLNMNSQNSLSKAALSLPVVILNNVTVFLGNEWGKKSKFI